MTQINLLPWREQERNLRKLRFFYALGGCIGLSIIAIIIIHLILSHRIQIQKDINTFFQSQIQLNNAEITELEAKQKAQLETRDKIAFLVNLQNESFKAVKLLNELVKIMPTTISLEILKREKNTITLIGIAQSNLDITLLMKRLANSTIFTQPVLKEISAKKDDPLAARMFQLQVEQQE